MFSFHVVILATTVYMFLYGSLYIYICLLHVVTLTAYCILSVKPCTASGCTTETIHYTNAYRATIHVYTHYYIRGLELEKSIHIDRQLQNRLSLPSYNYKNIVLMTGWGAYMNLSHLFICVSYKL